MPRKALKIGIMSREDSKKRTIAIVKGEYKPHKDEPKVWFESLQSLAQVLSDENRVLLKVIEEQKPKSIKALEEITGRKSSNLSRTLHTMASYGIVDLLKQRTKELIPIAKATRFTIDLDPSLKFKKRDSAPTHVRVAH